MDELSYQKDFNSQLVSLLQGFISRHESPVCLVAHNGDKFDFPVLKAELEALHENIVGDIYCGDSLLMFRKFDEVSSVKSIAKSPTTIAGNAETPIRNKPVFTQSRFSAAKRKLQYSPLVPSEQGDTGSVNFHSDFIHVALDKIPKIEISSESSSDVLNEQTKRSTESSMNVQSERLATDNVENSFKPRASTASLKTDNHFASKDSSADDSACTAATTVTDKPLCLCESSLCDCLSDSLLSLAFADYCDSPTVQSVVNAASSSDTTSTSIPANPTGGFCTPSTHEQARSNGEIQQPCETAEPPSEMDDDVANKLHLDAQAICEADVVATADDDAAGLVHNENQQSISRRPADQQHEQPLNGSVETTSSVTPTKSTNPNVVLTPSSVNRIAAFTPPSTHHNTAFTLTSTHQNAAFTPTSANQNAAFTPPSANRNGVFTPPPRKSFALGAIYERVVGRPMRNAQCAEDDCLALLRICQVCLRTCFVCHLTYLIIKLFFAVFGH